MGWMQKLYETYESCSRLIGVQEGSGKPPLMPIYHTTQQAQIEAVIDTDGSWRSAEVLEEKNRRTTLIPCTEKSASRTSDPVLPHPLFDSLSYLAGDYTQYREVKEDRKGRYAAYIEQLSGWCSSPFSHPKVCAVLAYLKKGRLMADLICSGILYADESGALPEKWDGPKDMVPPIFKAVTGDPANAFIRFQVVSAGGEEDKNSCIWEDPSVWKSFIDYQNSLPAERDICYVLGKEMPPSAVSPRYIRRPGDGAKLISANDSSGFTYRGRFDTPSQAYCIGRETSEKAHNALKWLIPRQAYTNGDQVILAWKTDGGKPLNPCKNSLDLLCDLNPAEAEITTGENFAYRFRNALKGYGGKLKSGERACIIGLDSVTPGRLSIFYNREIPEKDLVDRVVFWHETCRWHFWVYPESKAYEKGAKPVPFTGAPSPDMIVKAAYGKQANDKLKKSAVQRLLPCIADGAALPKDIVLCTVRRASNPVALEDGERAEVLATACALVRKYWNDRYNFHDLKKPRTAQLKEYEERWEMALNTEETDRNYLFGRLLALAEIIELSTYDEDERKGKRQTNAERMMTVFKKRPFTTWRNLYDRILPYEGKMSINQREYYKKQIDNIYDIINEKEYANDKPLNGLYLMGYHLQRKKQFTKKEQDSKSDI